MMKVGIIGCGNISDFYFSGCQFFDILEVTACADLDVARAIAKAEQHGIARATDVASLLADPEVDIVVNLTVPKAHAEVSLAALEAGKSVFSEKPIALRREDARRLLDLAREKELRVGCAPDTFLGAGLQTGRKLIDDGWIGEPVAATAFMLSHGMEHWHPDPGFFYQEGGGPLFDIGPYYFTDLIALLGPIARVSGSARASFAERLVTSQPLHGTRIPVDVPTHASGVLEFASGPAATFIMSFDVWHSQLPAIEVYGSEGTLSISSASDLDAAVQVRRADMDDWALMPHLHPFTRPIRGIGVADMAHAIQAGRGHRASGELAYHVLDAMAAVHESAREGARVELASRCERPEPLRLGPVEEALREI